VVSSGEPQRVLVLGGSSEIGGAILRRLAERRPLRALLLGRDADRMRDVANQLTAAGGSMPEVDHLDAEDLASHQEMITDAFRRLHGVDVVVHCVGILGAQQGLDADPDELIRVLSVNFVGAGSLLWHAMRALRDQGHGTLMLLSSVAAERPRASNAPYGAAKAGLDALAQGLADGLASTGVRVVVLRPGFVSTRMTAGLPKAPFAVTADAVAQSAVGALEARARTVWVPAVLRYVFAVLRHLPRPLYRRLPL
jgi:decaprenylphospho-beta-D-erythro-pentofuranosid-2-ulose 2-reductase